MDMEKQELSRYAKFSMLIALCFVFVACAHENKTQNSNESNGQEKTSKEFPCPSEKLSENPVDSNVFERILNIYIAEEEISEERNFIYTISNCWSDSTYLITLEYYNWNNKADSTVFKNSDKIASFKNVLICFDIPDPSVFPVSHSLEIRDNDKNKAESDNLLPSYNEYFNSIQFTFSPKKQRVIEILKDGGERPHKYELLFKSVSVM